MDQYDIISHSYDKIHNNDEADAENRLVIDIIGQTDSVLDIGCGTGLYLDYNPQVKDYIGVDPSRGMLSRFRAKHNRESVCSTFESFHTEKKFSSVICLFGAANHISAEAIKRIPTFCKNGGKYYVMLFKDNYTPVTSIKLGVPLHFEYHPVDILEGNVCEIGDFWMIYS